MKTEKIKYDPRFQARIMINKKNLVKTIGEQNIGFSTVCSGTASSISASGVGIDSFVHQHSIGTPYSFFKEGLFNTLRELGDNILNIIIKDSPHNSYDGTFFSGVSGASTPFASRIGRDYMRKGFEEYTRKFPT